MSDTKPRESDRIKGVWVVDASNEWNKGETEPVAYVTEEAAKTAVLDGDGRLCQFYVPVVQAPR